VHGGDLIVRVAKDDTDPLLEEPETRIFDLSGRPMKGWLLVGHAGVKTDRALRTWIDRGVTFAASLPPK